MEIVEDTLIRCAGDTPISIAEALVIAAIDENIHLDGEYFLMRRHPDLLLKLLPQLLASPKSPLLLLSVSSAVGSSNASSNNNRAYPKDGERKRKREAL